MIKIAYASLCAARNRDLWRLIRTVSLSAKIENLQSHKKLFSKIQNSHIPHTSCTFAARNRDCP